MRARSCESISKDSIAFYQGSQDVQKDLSNVSVIKIIDNVCEDNINPSAVWNIQSEDTIGRWRFPRINGQQETNPINTASTSNCNPENQQTLLQKLADTHSQNFLASCLNNQNWGFLDRVLGRLHAQDNRWGYFCPDGDCNNLSTDTIAYNCGTDDSTLSISIINIINCDQEIPQAIWVDETQNLIDADPNAEVGWRYPRIIYEDISQIVADLREPGDDASRDLASQAAAASQRVNGECSNSSEDCLSGEYEDIPDLGGSLLFQCTGSNGGSSPICALCPSDKTEPNYKVRSQKCLPSCVTAGGTHSGDECQDANYSSNLIVSYEDGLCCTRSPKNRVNGACNVAQKNCSAGDHNDLTDSDDLYIWECQGRGGGNTKNCTASRARQNGRCNYGASNPDCSVGRLEERRDSNTHEIWACIGTGGGTDAQCRKQKGGRCDNSRKHGCSSGTAENKRQANGLDIWDCVGSQSTRSSCSRSIPANGRCNNSVKNDCHDGTLRDKGDSRTHYRWECLGVGSGHKDECELRKSSTPATQRPTTPTTRRPITPTTRRPTPPATTPQKIIGRCSSSYRGDSSSSCAAGSFHNHPGHTSTHYRWTCRSIPHTNPNREVSCSVQKTTTPTSTTLPQKIVGRCGSYRGDSNASCAAGNFHNHPGHTGTEYRWTCRSIPHTSPNREVSCDQSK